MYNWQKEDETTAINETPMPSDKYIPKSKNWTTNHPATEANTATARGLNYEGPHWLVTDDWALPSDKIDSIFVKSGGTSFATAASETNESRFSRFETWYQVVIRTVSGKEYGYPLIFETEKEATSCVCRLAKELVHPIGKYTRIVVGENVVVDD